MDLLVYTIKTWTDKFNKGQLVLRLAVVNRHYRLANIKKHFTEEISETKRVKTILDSLSMVSVIYSL